jgi:hypothetical protein
VYETTAGSFTNLETPGQKGSPRVNYVMANYDFLLDNRHFASDGVFRSRAPGISGPRSELTTLAAP